jgi:hypothetical protein
MSLSDVSTVASIISSFAVAASLIYLALQTHQNAKHSRALVNQGRLALIADLNLKSTETDVAKAVLRLYGAAPTEENIRQAQFRSWITAANFGWMDSFAQHERGLLDDDVYRIFKRTLINIFSQPEARAVWENYLRVPGTKYAAFVDSSSPPFLRRPARESDRVVERQREPLDSRSCGTLFHRCATPADALVARVDRLGV